MFQLNILPLKLVELLEVNKTRRTVKAVLSRLFIRLCVSLLDKVQHSRQSRKQQKQLEGKHVKHLQFNAHNSATRRAHAASLPGSL